jgi:hypothetical protein
LGVMGLDCRWSLRFLAGLVENARFNWVIGSAVLAINDHLGSEGFDELHHIIGSSKIQQLKAFTSPKIFDRERIGRQMVSQLGSKKAAKGHQKVAETVHGPGNVLDSRLDLGDLRNQFFFS